MRYLSAELTESFCKILFFTTDDRIEQFKSWDWKYLGTLSFWKICSRLFKTELKWCSCLYLSYNSPIRFEGFLFIHQLYGNSQNPNICEFITTCNLNLIDKSNKSIISVLAFQKVL